MYNIMTRVNAAWYILQLLQEKILSLITRKKVFSFLYLKWWTLTKLILVVISRTCKTNHYAVHLKLIQWSSGICQLYLSKTVRKKEFIGLHKFKVQDSNHVTRAQFLSLGSNSVAPCLLSPLSLHCFRFLSRERTLLHQTSEQSLGLAPLAKLSHMTTLNPSLWPEEGQCWLA